jgi:integrase
MVLVFAHQTIPTRSCPVNPLRQRMIEDMQVRHLAPKTQSSYVQQVAAFARHFNKSPKLLGPEQIRTYQVYLTNKGLSASSLTVATAALRFLYRVTLKKPWSIEQIPLPKMPQRLPEILSAEEVARLLECVTDGKQHTILTTAYATGLRLSELCHLRITDIDSQRMVLRVEQGKGQKDRYVMLLEAISSPALAVSRSHGRTTGGQTRHREGLPESLPPRRHSQAYHPPQPAPRLRRASAGRRRRPAHHPTAARAPQPEHHGPLPPDGHTNGL